jgi:hypothetical protein
MKRTKTISLRVTEEEKRQIEQLAELNGMSITDYVVKSTFEEEQLKAIQALMAGDPVLAPLNLWHSANLELMTRYGHILPPGVRMKWGAFMEHLTDHIAKEFAKRYDQVKKEAQN